MTSFNMLPNFPELQSPSFPHKNLRIYKKIDKTFARPWKPWKRNWQKIHRGSPRFSTTSLGIVYLALKNHSSSRKYENQKWKCIEKTREKCFFWDIKLFIKSQKHNSFHCYKTAFFPQSEHKNKLKIMSFDFMAFFFFVYSISSLVSAPKRSRNFAESTDSEKILLEKIEKHKRRSSSETKAKSRQYCLSNVT
jgi:hypothetical protein